MYKAHTVPFLLFLIALLCHPLPSDAEISFSQFSHLFSRKPRSHANDFAVCAALKDRPEYVLEWVEYHLTLGVQKLYLFDTDNPKHYELRAVLQKFIEDGHIELYNLPRVTPRTVPMLQLRIYELCLDNLGKKHRFIGFWDVDEFLVPLDESIKFPDVLEDFTYKGGLAVNWRYMGPSGHIKRPPGGVLRNYLACLPVEDELHYTIKSIVNTKYALHPMTDPHSFAYIPDYKPTDIDGNPVDGPVSDYPNVQRLALYHYATKSLEDFKDKVRRGSAMGNRRDETFFDDLMARANETCPEALVLCRSWGLSWCYTGTGNGATARIVI